MRHKNSFYLIILLGFVVPAFVGCSPLSVETPPPVSAKPPPQIVGSVVGGITPSTEEPKNYGLYTYVLIPNNNNTERFKAFISALVGGDEDGYQGQTPKKNLNIILIPLHEISHNHGAIENYYFSFANEIIHGVCLSTGTGLHELCRKDMSNGPYLFTYTRPIRHLKNLPPPYLFVDFSNVHQGAFAYFIGAYKAQVKQDDFSDGTKIHTLRGDILNITLKAADWIKPIGAAVADMVWPKTKSS